MCAVMSDTNILAVEPVSPVSCELGPQWIVLVCPAHHTDAQLE